MKKLHLGICVLILILGFLQTLSQDRGVIVIPQNQKAELPKRTLAVIVGISKYPNLKQLDYADKDAYLFKSFLNSGAGGSVPDSNIKIMTEAEATSANFWLQGMRWLSDKKPQPGDRVYIYLAGHGDALNSSEYFFLTYDCEPGNDKNNYLLTGNIQLYNLKSRIANMTQTGVEVFLIMDACRTGDIPGGAAGLSDFAQSVAEKKAGEILLLSAGTNQVAFEDESFGGGHGLFTFYLIKGLGGEADEDQNGMVTFEELQYFIGNQVREASRIKFKKSQIPEFCCSQNREVVVAQKDKDFATVIVGLNDISGILNTQHSEIVKARTVTENKGLSQNPDYLGFVNALNVYEFTGENSADYYFERLLATETDENISAKLKSQYASALLNFAQAKINLYVSGKEDEYKIYGYIQNKDKQSGLYKLGKIARTTYLNTAQFMLKAMELLNNEPEIKELYKYKFQFLELYAAKENLKSNDPEVWMHTFNELTAKHPTAYMYNLAGIFASIFENYDAAKEYYLKAIEVAPSWFYPYNNIGVLYIRKSNGEDSARIWYERALELNPNGYMSLMNLGLLEEEQGNHSISEKLYLKALQIDTLNPITYHYLTGNAEKLKRKKEHLFYATKAFALAPDNFLYAFEAGNAHYKYKDYKAAVSALLKSNQLNSNHYTTHKLLAECYNKLKNKTEAEIWENSASKLKPANNVKEPISESPKKPISKSLGSDLFGKSKQPMTGSSGTTKAERIEVKNLTTRKLTLSNISEPTCADEQLGKVVVRVFINSKGVVLSATAGINTEDHNTTITSQCLLDWAKSNAQLLQFAESEEDKTKSGILVFEIKGK